MRATAALGRIRRPASALRRPPRGQAQERRPSRDPDRPPGSPAWHAIEPAAALAELGTSADGLADGEAALRLERSGPNALPRARREGPARIAWRQLESPLIHVLLASAVLAIALGKPVDGSVVLGVVVANAVIGFVQELRAGKAIAALRELVPEHATVIRDALSRPISVEEVVVGDIVSIAPGDRVPADLRLLAARAMRVDESALTGESAPAEKRPRPVPVDAPVADRTSMLHGGTVVAAGHATAVAVATGEATELGRISSMLRETTELATPLTRSMAGVARTLSAVISVVALILLAVGLARGYSFVEAMLAAISLAVAAIPEGIPAIITIALAVGVRRMARRRAIVRRLPAVEALGSTTVVCTDKTGTLTRNEMRVRALWTPAGDYELADGDRGANALTRAARVRDAAPDDLLALLLAGIVCNDATAGAGAAQVAGDPTEVALLTAAQAEGVDVRAARRQRPRLAEIPFDAERRYMATLNELPSGGRALFAKGAPEAILARCDSAAGRPLDLAAARSAADALAGRGMRVLAFAVASAGDEYEPGEVLPDAGLELLGLQAMIDPPRPEAIAAVGDCARAGIAVKMITGDHGSTAESIGRQLGLDGRAVRGADLEALSDEDLRRTAQEVSVFARVAPEHKLRLVRALQAGGEVVGMTGDGVNDAPALRRADVGVAMGLGGTAVSKEAADIVLTDDNFATIRAAVEEGRRVFDNIVKALAFALPTNLGEGLIILLAVLFFPFAGGDPLLPVEPVQILWINLVATVSLALPLAFEAVEPGIMERPPRRPGAPVLSGFLVARTLYVALVMTAAAVVLFLLAYDAELAAGAARADAVATAQTQAVTMIAVFQIFYLLTCRSLTGSLREVGPLSNVAVFVGIAALLVLQGGFVYLPVMNDLFRSAPLSLSGWAEAALFALPVLPLVAAEKRWRRRRGHTGAAGAR